MRKKCNVRTMWKKAYYAARNPDSYLADEVYKLDFPIRMLFDAITCVEARSAKDSLTKKTKGFNSPCR